MVRGKIMVIVDNSGDRIVSARQMWYIFNCESMLKPLSGKLVIEPTMHPDAPYFIILLCLTPDDFTHQRESAATQWVNVNSEL